MRELIVSTFVTLDGVMQGPGGPEEDESGTFQDGGWSVPFFDEQVGAFMTETMMSKPIALVIGRKTFEIMSAFWPTAPAEEDPETMNGSTKYVISRGTPDVSVWQNSVLLQGDAAETVAKLKQEDGPELQVHGSANLIQSLLQANLIDRFRLLIFPVVIGYGKRLFDGGTIPSGLRLVNSATSPSGVILATYEPTGKLETGSFA